MIKIANNLVHMMEKKSIGPITLMSALMHAATAEEDESAFKELLRGGVKGMGGDLGMYLGALGGGGVGYSLAGEDENLRRLQDRVGYGLAGGDENPSVSSWVVGGSLLGGASGAVGGYLSADAIMNSIGRKKYKGKSEASLLT